MSASEMDLKHLVTAIISEPKELHDYEDNQY